MMMTSDENAAAVTKSAVVMDCHATLDDEINVAVITKSAVVMDCHATLAMTEFNFSSSRGAQLLWIATIFLRKSRNDGMCWRNVLERNVVFVIAILPAFTAREQSTTMRSCYGLPRCARNDGTSFVIAKQLVAEAIYNVTLKTYL